MKKIISLMIAVFLVGVLPVSAKTENNISAKTENNIKNVNMDSRAEALITLGIIEDFVPEADVTKYMVRDSLNKIFGSDSITSKFFGESYTDQKVSLDNVLAVLLDALGYTDYTGAKWNGYNQVSRYAMAKSVDLISGDIKINQELTMQLYVELIWKALFEVRVYDVSDILSRGAEVSLLYNERGTLGENCLGLHVVSGVINGICDVNIKRDIDSEDGIVIGDDYYKITVSDTERYIGRYAECLVNKETGEAKAVRVVEQKNTVWKFTYEDSDNRSTLSKLYYYNDKGKLNNITLDNVDVVYNGVCMDKPNNEALIQENAFYTVIDNDKDGKAEVILIDVYDVVRVEIISKGTSAVYLTAKNGKNYDFKKFYEDGREILDADGNEVEWIEVASNDILLIRRGVLPDDSGSSGMINDMNLVLWSMDKVNGPLNSMNSDKTVFEVDGAEYKLTPELLNDEDKMKSLKAGDDVTCYMDIFGRIADIDVYNSLTKVVAVIKFGSRSDPFGDKVLVKCLTEDNKVEVFEFKEKVILDGNKVSSEELLGSRYSYKFFSNGKVIEQLVKVRLNSSGEITAITTADGIEDDDFHKMSAPMTPSFYESWGVRIMNGKYVADSKTKVFTVYTDNEEFCNASATGAISSTEYTLYCVDEDTYHVGYILNPYSVVEGDSNAYVWGTSTAYLVLGNGKKLDTRDGEIVPYLLCWNGSKQVALVCKSPTLKSTNRTDNSLAYLTANSNQSNYLYKNLLKQVGWSGWKSRAFMDLTPGTVINANVNDGYVTSFDICFAPDYVEEDLEKGTWNSLPFEAAPTYNDNNYHYGVSLDKFYHALIYAYGEVQRLTPYGPIVNNHLPTNSEIKAQAPAGTVLDESTAQAFMNGNGDTKIFPVSDWDRLYPLDTTAKIWFYNFKSGKMFSGDFSDLVPGDRAFVRRTGGNMLMIVYRAD